MTSTRRTLAAVVMACSLVTGCRNGPGATPQADGARVPGESVLSGSSNVATRAASDEAHTLPSPALLPPLENVDWLDRMTLADGSIAYVAPPVGARELRPLIVAVHGAGDRPEWACGGWRLASSAYGFVVCPQGTRMDARRFAWDSPRTIARRVQGALDAVRARFGAYIADGPALYAGFSQGATMAGSVLLDGPLPFPVVALAEGGYDLLRDRAFLRRLRARGTSRVMIVCGSPACFRTATEVRSNLAREGLEAIGAGDPLSGHNLNQRMQDALRAAWPSLVAGLPGWSSFSAYVTAGGGR